MKILIVEDRPEIGRLLVRYLEPLASDSPILVKTMAEALSVIRTVDPLDLITIDLGLPDSLAADTVDRLKEIRTLKPNSVLIVITGVVTREDEKRIVEAGADGFIHKLDAPDKLTLLERIMQILRGILAVPQNYTRHLEIVECLAHRVGSHIASLGTVAK